MEDTEESSNVMASFSALVGDFLFIALIVPHNLKGSDLRSSVSTNCLHVCLRCSVVVLVISSFICCRVGWVGSLELGSSRALIFSYISSRPDLYKDSITQRVFGVLLLSE